LAAIIAKLANNLDLPITVKLRTGFDHCDLKEIASIARSCEKSGAAALFIHGRTKGQGYSGEPDYRAVKEIKSAVDIPVYGSGSIFSKELADRMFKETGCDGVLVARGALGNPWIFKQLQGPFEVSLIERIRVLKKHLSYIDQYCEAKPRSKIGIMRKVALWYLKGFPNSARIRAKIGRAADQEHLLKIIDQEVGLP
jgi:tRNA-dihydrouridine synthase